MERDDEESGPDPLWDKVFHTEPLKPGEADLRGVGRAGIGYALRTSDPEVIADHERALAFRARRRAHREAILAGVAMLEERAALADAARRSRYARD